MSVIQQLNFSSIRIDWMLLLLPMPFFIGMLLDALAWKQLLPPHLAVRFKSLFGAQVGAEAVLLSIPGGFAMTDPIKLYILKTRFHIPPFHVLSSLITRHWLLGMTQLMFFCTMCLIAFFAEQQQLLNFYVQDGTMFIAIGILIMVSISLGVVVRSLMRGTLARGVWKILYGINFRPLRKRLKRSLKSFKEADRCFAEAGKKNDLSILYAILLYFCLWTMDTWETLLVAHAIGIHISFFNALLIETVLSALRLGMFFLPGGVVVKEIGYFALLTSFRPGITALQIGAFILLKRLVFVFCMAIGYIVLLGQGVGSIWNRTSISYKTILENQ